MAKVEIVTERHSGGRMSPVVMVRVDGHWLIDGHTGDVWKVDWGSMVRGPHMERVIRADLDRVCRFLQREEHP